MVLPLVLMIYACTGNLTHDEPFRNIVGRNLVLGEGFYNWVLVNNPSASITRHSEGNRLYLVPETDMQRYLQPDPAGQSELVAQANGAAIRISRVLEYGMETGYPVALGEITLPDSTIVPFETEWRDSYFDQLEIEK
jgi:hypothetical protein